MKYLQYLFLALSLGLFACNSDDGDGEGGNGESEKEKKRISSRDYSITKENSYSDLFLDSLAMEKFIVDRKVPDSIRRRMRSFYNTRNFQYAWFSSDGLTEQAKGFWNLHDYHTTYAHDTSLHDKKLQRRMDDLIFEPNFTVSSSNAGYLQTELQLTQHFIQYMMGAYDDFIKRKEMERFVPFKKRDAVFIADSLINKKHKDNKYFEDVNIRYGQLKDQLKLYHDLTAKGGWPTVSMKGKSLKIGATSPEIRLIKQRLQLTGDMAAGDTSQVFTDTLENGVKNFQIRHGYTPTGVITAQLVKDMNVPAKKRLQQILINMERMRWMPNEPTSDNLVVVNIPEFVLHMYEGKKKVWDMNVVVGKEGHNTMMFTGDLNQVVFSPYWNVPPSIVKSEILPAMSRNPGYLDGQNMEIVGEEGGLPVIRQRPGGKNSLGRVKFLFPNSFNIYFHDTPAKSLFSQDKRAYSHGCIRLSDPYKMAEYLLRNQPEWTPDRINDAMNAGTEKYVKLKKAVPVFITYYTAWVDDDGRLNFRDDIYDHDQKLARKVFNDAVVNTTAKK